MARRTSQGSWMGGSTLPSGTARPDLPPVEAWGESNLDQRPAKSRSPNGKWSSTLPSPRRSAQLIRATRWRRRRQIADHHVVDHAPTQRADLSHRELLSDEVVQQPTLSDKRPRRQPLTTAKRFRCVPGMLNSSEVKVLYPT